MEATVSTEELCDAIRQGSLAAEHELYATFIQLARSIAFRWLKNHDDAQDIAQEALLSVLCRLRGEGISDQAKLEGYIRGTVKFLAWSHIRRHGASRTYNLDAFPENITREDRDGFVIAAQAEMDKQVTFLIEKLEQERDRLLLKHHYLDDISKTELCMRYDLEPAQFDRVAHRARRRLRKTVETMAPELARECC